MKTALPIALLALVLTAALGIAADKERPSGEPPAPPSRHVEERPFGGPPPKYRGQRPPEETRHGKRCRTDLKTCALEKELLLGAACSCPPDRTDQGKVVE